MRTVYRATDLALEKTVALKVMAHHLADDDTFVRRFHEEAKALAQQRAGIAKRPGGGAHPILWRGAPDRRPAPGDS